MDRRSHAQKQLLLDDYQGATGRREWGFRWLWQAGLSPQRINDSAVEYADSCHFQIGDGCNADAFGTVGLQFASFSSNMAVQRETALETDPICGKDCSRSSQTRRSWIWKAASSSEHGAGCSAIALSPRINVPSAQAQLDG
jgi:hypothetical protein